MAEPRTLKIALDYQLPPKKEGEVRVEGAELTEDYINHAVNNTHQQGLEGQQRRIYGRIQRKLETAIVERAETIELEQAEADFLKKSFETCKSPSGVAKYFVILEDAIEEATKRS